jgi:amino acid transporter
MKKIVNTIIVALVAVFGLFSLFTGVSRATGPCFDTEAAQYTSTECVKERFGLNKIDPQNLLVKRDPMSYVVVAFRIILGVAVLLTIFRIVIAGLKITNSKDDADKRKEGFKTVGWAIAGMVIALSALGLTYLVQSIFFGETFNDQIVDCTNKEFVDYASDAVKARCDDVINP